MCVCGGGEEGGGAVLLRVAISSRLSRRPPGVFYKVLEHPAGHDMSLKFPQSPLKSTGGGKQSNHACACACAWRGGGGVTVRQVAKQQLGREASPVSGAPWHAFRPPCSDSAHCYVQSAEVTIMLTVVSITLRGGGN